jgi:hypothetical protein
LTRQETSLSNFQVELALTKKFPPGNFFIFLEFLRFFLFEIMDSSDSDSNHSLTNSLASSLDNVEPSTSSNTSSKSRIHPSYEIEKLRKPVRVGGDWFERGYYSIRLKGYNANGSTEKVRVYGAQYQIRLNLTHVPPHKALQAFKFCMYEIFYILKHNEYVETGPDHVRLVLLSNKLNDGQVNLRNVDLDKDGADMFIEEIERTMQSHETLLLDRNMKLYICSTKVVQK